MQRYNIVQHISRGSFGYVVKAYDTQTRKNVAIKIFTKGCEEAAEKEILVYEFLKPKYGTTVRNVVAFYESFQLDGQWHVVLELLGNNLRQLMYETGIGLIPKNLRIVAKSIFSGLEFLHISGLIHTDLKPENIAILKTGSLECKIVDLGLCLIVEELESTQIFKKLLQHRMYRAPEVLLKAPIDEKIDVFSVGCILAELCTRKIIFSGDNNVSQMAIMVEYLGLPSLELLKVSLLASAYFDFSDTFIAFKRIDNMRRVQPRSRPLQNFFKDYNQDNFINFMERCLSINPDDRASASELLGHPWMKGEDNKKLSPTRF